MSSFDTWGPFNLPSHDHEGIRELFRQIQADPTLALDEGIGIYIVAAKNSAGVLVPWYVGQTYRGFGKRFIEHFEKGRFLELSNKVPLTFFLLGLATKGKIKRSSPRIKQGKGLRVLNQLEFMLIGVCLKLNKELLNKREAVFHKYLWVAGFRDEGPEGREPAARALAELLRT